MTAPRIFAIALVALLAAFVVPPTHAAGGPSETILYSFTGQGDGAYPYGALIFDQAGDLYGTTQKGGTHNAGTVFKLTPSNGGWTETVIYNFGSHADDGGYPQSDLVFDPSGNLYGTTVSGGRYDDGTVFQLSPSSNGTWTETVLYSFACCSGDAFGPVAGVYLDASGNVFGTTEWGGTGPCQGENPGCGAFYELTKSSSGWKEAILYNFQGTPDSALPYGDLTRDSAGNFYGTTLWGGSFEYAGSVYKLSQAADGTWSNTVIFTQNADESGPSGEIGAPALDSQGNLFISSEGDAFELSPSSSGYIYADLYHYSGGIQPANPYSGLVWANPNVLYGTTSWGGGGGLNQCSSSGCGTIYKLKRTNGVWQGSVAWRFRDSANGWYPTGNVILDKSGHLYGTTVNGGAYGYGVVYEITPQ